MRNFWNKLVTDLAYVPKGKEVKPHISSPATTAYYASLVTPPKETQNITQNI